MTGPRANFKCANCCKTHGDDFKIEDLPIASIRCPLCGRKRGFVRLFDALGGVISGKTNNVTKLAEEVIKPLYEQHAVRTEGARNFERAGKEAMEKAYEKASPEQRARMTPFGGQVIPAAAALGAIPPAARAASRELTYPASKRYVVPQWADTKKS